LVLAFSSGTLEKTKAYVVKAGLAEPLADLTGSDMVICRQRCRDTRGRGDGISRLDWLRRGRAEFQGKSSQATLLNWTGDRCRVSTRHEVLHSYYRTYYTRERNGEIYQRNKEKRHHHRARKARHPTRNVLNIQAPPSIFPAPLPCTTVTVAGGGAAEEATDDAGTF
jgi:hypothetical protein